MASGFIMSLVFIPTYLAVECTLKRDQWVSEAC